MLVIGKQRLIRFSAVAPGVTDVDVNLKPPAGIEWSVITAFGSHSANAYSVAWRLNDDNSSTTQGLGTMAALAANTPHPLCQIVTEGTGTQHFNNVEGLLLDIKNYLVYRVTAPGAGVTIFLTAVVIERPAGYVQHIIGDMYDKMRRHMPVADWPDRVVHNG